MPGRAASASIAPPCRAARARKGIGVIPFRFLSRLLAGTAVFAAVSTGPAVAQTDFSGETITVYAGGQPGSGVDVFTRTFMPYYAKALPGRPTIVIKNMFSARGTEGVAYAYKNGATDGTTLTTMASGPIQEAVFGGRKPAYDIHEFKWVGSLAIGQSTCFVWHDSKIKSVEDMINNQVTVSATGSRSNSKLLPLMINHTTGTRMKPVVGYGGAGSVLAVERQEVDGRCIPLDTLEVTYPDWIGQNKVRFLIDASLTPNERLPEGTPNVMNLIEDPKDRLAMRLFLLPAEVTIPYGLAPETDPEAVATHRTAFRKAVSNPSYLADARRHNQDIRPKSGEEVTAIIEELFTAPPDMIRRVKRYIGDNTVAGRCQGNLCQRPKKNQE
jgi:tripartite-type tricarboxylate transporter receptor subunit TctC